MNSALFTENLHALLSRIDYEAIPESEVNNLMEIDPNVELEVIPVLKRYLTVAYNNLGKKTKSEWIETLIESNSASDDNLQKIFDMVNFVFNEEIRDKKQFLRLIHQSLEDVANK